MLYELAVALEFIFDRCPNVYVAGLLLMRVYCVLGNMQRVISLFNRLDIKYIQRDSLGYLTFTLAMQYGRFKEAICFYTSMTAQFDQNEREVSAVRMWQRYECAFNMLTRRMLLVLQTSESIVTANRVLSLDKIPQLVGFLERCRNSIYARGADVLNQLLSACFAVENFNFVFITLHGDEERVDWQTLTDPRDFDVIECLALKDRSTLDELRQLSFDETVSGASAARAVRLTHEPRSA